MTEHNVTEIPVSLPALREFVRACGEFHWADSVDVRIRTVWIDATLVPVGDVTFWHSRDYPAGRTMSYVLLGAHASQIPER